MVLLLAMVAGSSYLDGTMAASTSTAGNAGNGFATAAVTAPTALTAAAAGQSVVLGWTAGAHGNGHRIEGAPAGAGGDCAGAALAGIGTATGTSYTDAGRFAPQGTFYCYRVATTYGPTWTSQVGNPTAAAQIGFVASSVALANGGTPGTLDAGDQIAVRFNQAVDPATGPTATSTVCASALGIFVGSTTTSGLCLAGETLTVGTLSGVSVSVTNRWNATYTWSADRRTLTVALGARTVGVVNPVVTGAWTFSPTTAPTRLLSATGGFHVCDTNSGGGQCLPTATGGF